MKKRRIIALLLSVLIMTAVVFSAPFSVSAAEVRESVGLNIPASGQKGDIYWSFDSSTSTLTLTGKGDMSFHVYWAAGGSGNEDTSIKKVVISSGITSISKYAFGLCTELEEVVLGYGLKRIGFGAFRSCKKLRELKTPTSLETIEDRAFDKCVSLSRTVLNPGLKKNRQLRLYRRQKGHLHDTRERHLDRQMRDRLLLRSRQRGLQGSQRRFSDLRS